MGERWLEGGVRGWAGVGRECEAWMTRKEREKGEAVDERAIDEEMSTRSRSSEGSLQTHSSWAHVLKKAAKGGERDEDDADDG